MQLLAAQTSLMLQIQELRSGGPSETLTAAEAQLSELAAVQQRLASGTISVGALRAEVAATVAAATVVTAQAKTSAGASAQQVDAALQSASAEARRAVDAFVSDFYEKKIFDPYLHFASPEDERAYREREDVYRRAIASAEAEGSPEGDLRAIRLTQAQLGDAGEHGATASPDFQRHAEATDRAEASLTRLVEEQGQTVVSTDASARETLDTTQPSLVSPDLIASLRATGATLSPSEQAGHGLTASRPIIVEGGVAL